MKDDNIEGAFNKGTGSINSWRLCLLGRLPHESFTIVRGTADCTARVSASPALSAVLIAFAEVEQCIQE